ncbi:MAG: hypothetical protein AB1403_07120 [Candidatus Riflebacteria bacterium]
MKKIRCARFIGNLELGKVDQLDLEHESKCEECRKYRLNYQNSSLHKLMMKPGSSAVPSWQQIQMCIAAAEKETANSPADQLVESIQSFYATLILRLALAGMIIFAFNMTEPPSSTVLEGQNLFFQQTINAGIARFPGIFGK